MIPRLLPNLGNVFWNNTAGKRVGSSLVNGVACLNDAKYVQEACKILVDDKTHFLNLRPLTILMHELKRSQYFSPTGSCQEGNEGKRSN